MVYHRVADAAITPDYFMVLGARVHSGRTFDSADREAGARTVIVNESFVRRVLGGRNLVVGLSGIALLLSLAGIYAVTSFTVARRTREIGIRVALGADARRVLTTIFARPLLQVGIGVVAGGCITGALACGIMRGALGASGAALIVAYAALMMGVCLLACVVPTAACCASSRRRACGRSDRIAG